ncbi:hypothetical protein ACQ4PT_031159 [Festuca glaucescens]
MDDSPSVMRTESNQEGSVLKDQTHSLPERQNRNQGVATNAEMSDDMWREQIMPISQNVYKQIRLLQQLIPINCKYTPNALYKEYLLNLEAYLDRVMEDLSSKLPSEGAMDLLVQKGVVCSCCGLLNSPLACETCNCLVARDTDKNAVENRLNISFGITLKLPDNVRKVDAAVANEDVPAKIEGDFPESTSKGSGSAVYGSGATMKTCKFDSLACVTTDRGDCKDGSSGSLPLPSSKRNSSESLAVQHDSSVKKQKMSVLEEGSSKMASEADQTSYRVPCDPLDEPLAWEEIERIEKFNMLSKKKYSYSSSSGVMLPEPLLPVGSVCMTSSTQHQYLDGGPSMLQSSQPGLSSGYQSILRDRNAKTFHGGPRTVNFVDPPASQVMLSNIHDLHLSNYSSSQAANPHARTSSVSRLNAGFAGYGHDRSSPYQGSSFQSTYTGHNSSYNTFGQQTFQSSQSAGRYNSGQHDDETVGGSDDFVVPPFPDFMIRSPHVRATPQYHQNSYGQQQRAFRELGADPNALKNYIIEPNLPCRIYNFDVVMLPVREEHFWIVVVANFMQQRFEIYCPYYDATAAENIAMIVIDNFKKAYTSAYYSECYNIYNFQIMPAQIVSDNVNENDSGPHAMKVILQHSGGFQHKIRENDIIKLREQLAFYMLAFQEAGRDKARFVMDSGEASKKLKVEEAVDLRKNAFRSVLTISRITREMLGIDVGSVDTIEEATIGQSNLFASSFVVAAGLNKFLGHSKFLVVDNYACGSVLVKFQDTSDLQKVDGMVFKSELVEPIVVTKVYYVQAQSRDYAELLDLFVPKSNF